MTAPPTLDAAAAPHLEADGPSMTRLMWDVLFGLLPVIAVALWTFGAAAALQLSVCLAAALLTEAVCSRLRGRRVPLLDGSAAITGLILACSLPPGLPWYAGALGGVVAVGLGKAVFGGLGQNVFNPAMVGRAFLMACFPVMMTRWRAPGTVDALSGATPLAAARFEGVATPLEPLLTGQVPGSLGETSAAAILLGGLWIFVRGAGDWRPCAGMLVAVAGIAALSSSPLGVAGHLLSGGVMLGACFIVTDPVTTPLSARGRWLFGLCCGGLVMLIRLHGGYAEGVMFAVLLCNAATPLIDRLTMPRPLGGVA